MSYIERPSTGQITSKDIFVDLPAEEDDEKNLILVRGVHAFTILNAFPYATGHLLVAPFRQVADIVDLDDDELLEIQRLVCQGVQLVRKGFNPNAFNIGLNMGQTAGAGIPHHLHWHVVPRWGGDTNFMSVIANTKVMPQSLDDTYRKLKGLLNP